MSLSADELRGLPVKRPFRGSKRLIRVLDGVVDVAEAKREAARIYRRTWARNNPEKELEYRARYMAKPGKKEQQYARQREWRKDNISLVRAQSAAHMRLRRLLHRDLVNARKRAYYIANRERIRARQNELNRAKTAAKRAAA